MTDKKIEILKLIREKCDLDGITQDLINDLNNIIENLDKQSLSKKTLLNYMIEDIVLLINKPRWDENDRKSIFFYLGNLMARINKELENDL